MLLDASYVRRSQYIRLVLGTKPKGRPPAQKSRTKLALVKCNVQAPQMKDQKRKDNKKRRSQHALHFVAAESFGNIIHLTKCCERLTVCRTTNRR